MDTPITEFMTHDHRLVKGKELQDAFSLVANDYVNMVYRAHKEDMYATHVTQNFKDEELKKGLEEAERIRKGYDCDNFTVWQRINEKLTGECIALLP